MENLKRRGLSLLLALVMIVSLFAGIRLPVAAATVDYVYSGNYVYNWGTRGTTATFLSPMAEDWYEKYNVTYDELASYSGSDSTSSVPSSALYSQLSSLMSGAHSKITSYDDTTSLYQYTDCQNSAKDSDKISSFYSGKAIGPSWDSGSTWNREHVWPNSKGEGSSENDIMMLRPTSTNENGDRGNTAYGEGSSFYHPNTESNGVYDLRGDVCRIALYVYVRWGNSTNLANMWGSGGVIESLDILLAWMEADPVDTWELGRNDAVQSITGTRNVFVDYPELAFLLFSEEVPDVATPSGEAASSSYTVNAISSNNAHGTVSLSGRVITATPADGYYASGYTVTSGTATVTQNGNIFNVSASSDCTIQINFAAKTAVAVTFSENGIVGNVVTAYAGDEYTFPALANSEPSGYTFLGWVDSSLDETTEEPSTIHAVGEKYIPIANTTYYALYKRNEGGSGDSQTVTFEFGANGSGGHTDSSADKATYTETVGAYTLSITGGSKFYPTSYDEKGNSAIKLGASSAVGKFSFTVEDEVNTVIIKIAGYKANNAKVSINGGTAQTISTHSNDGEYTDIEIDTSTNKTISFTTVSGGYRAMMDSITYVVGVAGTNYYTTSACAHAGTKTNVPQQDATCTEIGYTAGVKCNDCGGFISGHEAIAAPGHSYSTVVTPPTATQQGYTTYDCINCDDSYVSDYTDPVGETYTVSFRVPTGVTSIADMNCNATGITLPTAGVPTGDQSYTFLGWVTAAIDNSEEKPTFYAAGDSFTTDANTTLIALYTYTVGGSAESSVSFEFGDDVDTTTHKDGSVISEGETYSNGDYSLKLTSVSRVYDGANDATGKSALKLGTISAAAAFSFTVPDNVATVIINAAKYKTNTSKLVVNNTTKTLSLNSDDGQYEEIVVDTSTKKTVTVATVSGGYRAMIDSITYVISATGTTYYTTEIDAACEHDYSSVVTPPTATEQGYTTYTCSKCGDTYKDNFTDALGYTVSFIVPTGVTAVSDMSCGKNGITLPTAGVPTGEQSYSFLGWVAETVDNSEEKPTFYAAGDPFTTDADTTLIALYTYTTGGSGAMYTKVTTAPADWSGEYVTVYEDGSRIFDGSLDTFDAVNNYRTVTIANNTITAAEGDPYKFTIAAYSNGYSIQGISGKYIGNGSNSNSLTTSASALVNNISLNDDGSVNIISEGGAYLRYNATSGQDRFRYYKSSPYSNQKAISLYVRTQATGTTYYTTEIGGSEDDQVLKFSSASLVIETGISINYKVKGELFTNGGGIYSDPYAVFNLGGHETTVQGVYDSEDNVYVFQLKNIQPDWMGETVSADLFAYVDGELVQGESKDDYSVKAYCESQLAQNADNQTLRTLLVDILNYGAAAQKYTDPQVADDDLVNADLTEEQKAWGTSTTPELSAEPVFGTELNDPTAAFKGAALFLRETVRIRLRFSVDSIEDVTVTAQIGNGTPTELTDFTSAGNGSYYVFFDGLLATQMREPVTFTVLKDGTAISNTLVYSVEAYAASVNTSNTALTNMIYAMMNYGDAAYNYAN